MDEGDEDGGEEGVSNDVMRRGDSFQDFT